MLNNILITLYSIGCGKNSNIVQNATFALDANCSAIVAKPSLTEKPPRSTIPFVGFARVNIIQSVLETHHVLYAVDVKGRHKVLNY